MPVLTRDDIGPLKGERRPGHGQVVVRAIAPERLDAGEYFPAGAQFHFRREGDGVAVVADEADFLTLAEWCDDAQAAMKVASLAGMEFSFDFQARGFLEARPSGAFVGAGAGNGGMGKKRDEAALAGEVGERSSGVANLNWRAASLSHPSKRKQAGPLTRRALREKLRKRQRM